MPYVLRNPQGQIDSVHRQPVPGSQRLPDQHAELRELIGDVPHDTPRDAAFADLDAGLIRVLEDLVDVLVARNVIRITDLPVGAQQKLFARKNFRDRFKLNSLQLFDEASTLGTGLIPSMHRDETSLLSGFPDAL